MSSFWKTKWLILTSTASNWKQHPMKSIQNYSTENASSSIRIMQELMFIWWPGKNCCSLSGKFWFIYHIHQTLCLWIFIYFGLKKILLMEKISILWKTVKGTWNSSLVKKIKSFWKMKLWSYLKNGKSSGTKQWIHYSVKLLVKMKTMSFSFT